MDFYGTVAEHYNEMTNAAQRLSRADRFVAELAKRFQFRSALDVACGTGLYTLALARSGVPHVAGVDLSPEMLAAARRETGSRGFDIAWHQAPMQEVDAVVPGQWDLILCLGNSIPHLLTGEDLDRTLAAFRRTLSAGGYLGIQLLNYERILNRKERIVSIDRHANREFIRFYDFLEETIRFNLLIITWEGDTAHHEIQSTELYPYREAELRDALCQHGFGQIQSWDGLSFAPYEPGHSQTLLLTAHKPGCVAGGSGEERAHAEDG